MAHPTALIGKRVVASNPAMRGMVPWRGTAVAYVDRPSLVIDQPDGTRVVLDAAWCSLDERELPTKPGTVITWLDGAYLPQIAQLDGGEYQHGWWWQTSDGGRWYKPADLLDALEGAHWTVLVPESAAVS